MPIVLSAFQLTLTITGTKNWVALR